ncbi:hypothetical protein ISN44_As09g003250 [Arabidopsis suecica]|uniref:Uncharacterized protein n=1 Tax=Arabidopsis suecica TaxID=45249 RepID=A0A8T2AEN1_ARASU|nr:hypothetical protein ISN44_As09g003250 [Arabidopsis suecica]
MQLKDLFWEWRDFLFYVPGGLNSIGRKRKRFVEHLTKKKRESEHKRKMKKDKKNDKKKKAKEEKKNID